MEITVLNFGITKEIIGHSNLKIVLKEDSSVLDLEHYLHQNYPELQKLKSLFIAVNQEYSNKETILKPSDEIALIPPVSGG